MCDQEAFAALKRRVADLETRLNAVHDEMRDSFAAINTNIETLSQQLTNMDRRIIDEKQKWGEVTRSIVKWTVRAILSIVVYAAGINITKSIITLWN